jgi:hypothetical protein
VHANKHHHHHHLPDFTARISKLKKNTKKQKTTPYASSN